jgi:hypothetical protein
VIRGQIRSSRELPAITVSSGVYTATTSISGNYSLEGLPPGAYVVTPDNVSRLILPASQTLTVGPDRLNIDFRAFMWNSLEVEGVSNQVIHLIYAGTNGQTLRVLASTNVVNWSTISTNIVGSEGTFDFFDLISSSAGARYYQTVRH